MNAALSVVIISYIRITDDSNQPAQFVQSGQSSLCVWVVREKEN